MASRDDSPTSLQGQPWSVWADRLGRDSPLSDGEEARKDSQQADSMKLPAQDMCYYGLCPVQDEFYLVICNFCGQVYTPQGLKNHIELRHSRSTEPQPPEPPDSGCSVQQLSKNSKPKKNVSVTASSTSSSQPTSLAALLSGPTPAKATTKAARRDRSGGKSGSFSHERANPKVPAAVSSTLTGIPFDKIPSPQQPPPTEQTNVAAASLGPTLAAQSPVSPLTGAGLGLPQGAAITMTVAVDSSGLQTVQIHLPEIAETSDAELPEPAVKSAGKRRKPSKSERRLLPLKDREFDPEKHCGVWMSDANKPCTRSLTCKAHSLTLRRGVAGRSRPFDDLLAEHRASKEALTKQSKEGNSGSMQQQPVKVVLPPSSVPASPTLTSILKSSSSVATKTVNARPKTLPSQISPTLNPAPTLAALLQSTPSAGELSLDIPAAEMPISGATPLLQRVISVAAVQQPAKTLINSSAHHPRPLAVCTFGLRRPNQAWSGLRAALGVALQKPAVCKISRSCATPMQSLLRPPLLESAAAANGFRLGVKRPSLSGDVSKIKFRKVATKGNGLSQSQQQQDLMDGFEGLVGEDGVLTFLSQGEEEAATLNLMADLSAGNITFSEIMTPEPGAGVAASSPAAQVPVTLRLLSSTTGLLLQHDPGDQL